MLGSTPLAYEITLFIHMQYGTPLTTARSKGHEKIVQLLLEANRQR